jgi:hypothetical protein
MCPRHACSLLADNSNDPLPPHRPPHTVTFLDQGVKFGVSRSQDGGVLVACGHHALVAPQGGGDGVVGKGDVEGVAQLGLELGDGPVAGEAAVSQPAEDVPADEPPGQSDLGFGQGAESVGVGSAARVGTVGEFTDDLQGTLEGEDAVEAVVANGQGTSAHRAVFLLDGEDLLSKDGVGRPTVTHLSSLADGRSAVSYGNHGLRLVSFQPDRCFF